MVLVVHDDNDIRLQKMVIWSVGSNIGKSELPRKRRICNATKWGTK